MDGGGGGGWVRKNMKEEEAGIYDWLSWKMLV